ncbi:low affinity Fe/Cu permease [Panacagrimonas perspica]|uniref:Low affinity Fe/Cu permease n=1 Tax=Panacagrimonas perspica TaxID=381431 RepID=A0A4R7NZP1_9GAMM|nr:low affinity iron permease family protein [Panacagrimonas perspica]TDU26389.1 low affinity Fe/Cu permease [Panacagrimonas perspica]THD02026.1 hypothetical protein B1810_16140 [Panacagrimonas perspica]
MTHHVSFFTRFAQRISHAAGEPYTFTTGLGLVIVWGLSGPLFGFGDTWQLVINTSTTIVTFLMVFLIQNTQNRDSAAMQIKLDELIRATPKARDTLLDLEELSEDDLEKLRAEYERRAERARKALSARRTPGTSSESRR